MAKETEELATLVWLRQYLRSGNARELVDEFGLSCVAIGEIIDLTPSNVWNALAGKQFPRRANALRLARLLEQLEVVRRGS